MNAGRVATPHPAWICLCERDNRTPTCFGCGKTYASVTGRKPSRSTGEDAPMPGRCATCRHWKTPDGFINLLSVAWRDGEEWDDHNRRQTERNAGYGDCEAVRFYENVTEDEPRPPFLAWDGSGYKAGVSTLGTFGCVLHEEAPDA